MNKIRKSLGRKKKYYSRPKAKQPEMNIAAAYMIILRNFIKRKECKFYERCKKLELERKCDIDKELEQLLLNHKCTASCSIKTSIVLDQY